MREFTTKDLVKLFDKELDTIRTWLSVRTKVNLDRYGEKRKAEKNQEWVFQLLDLYRFLEEDATRWMGETERRKIRIRVLREILVEYFEITVPKRLEKTSDGASILKKYRLKDVHHKYTGELLKYSLDENVVRYEIQFGAAGAFDTYPTDWREMPFIEILRAHIIKNSETWKPEYAILESVVESEKEAIERLELQLAELATRLLMHQAA